MTPWSNSNWRVVILTAVVFISLCAPPAAALGSSSSLSLSSSAPTALESGVYQQQNNSTVQHENPDSANQDGNLDAVESYLARILAERLGDSSIQLNQGEYEQARQLVGDDYSKNLEKYIDVAGDTGNERTADRFEETQETQQGYTDTVQNFRQTYDEYQEAKQNGNEQRARELARELNTLAQRSNRQSTQLNESYTALSNQTGADFTDAQESVDEIQQNISTQEQSVLEEEFTPTTLAVDAEPSTISFREPLQVSGQLTTEDGSALADQTIRLETAGRNVTTTTDADGEFSLTYRPTVLPLSTENVTVRYVPEASSIYLGANETVDVSVSQTDATLQVTESPTAVAYGDELTVTGSVAVDDVAVADAPLIVSVGSTPIATTRTTSEGGFQVETTLPANVSAGSQELRVRLSGQDRAVTATPATTPIQIEETPTSLTVDANNSSSRSVTVAGQFQTADGRPLSGHELEFVVDGTLVGTTTTASEGRYRTQLQIPKQQLSGEATAVQITAVYTGERTNLASTRAKTLVTVTTAGNGDVANTFFPGDDSSVLYWIGGGLAVVLLLAGGGLLYLRRTTAEPTQPTDTEDTFATTPDQPDSTLEADQSLLELAQTRVASGETKTAIEAAYEALRARFAAPLGLSSAATHWELYRAYQAQIGEHTTTLREFVERYERATYGRDAPSPDEASEAVSLSSTVLESETRSSSDDD
ncbi:hypothetical protein SAMN04487950_0382 [Halogranum rubrum]|uniref:DUF4129 domain-containing protein n=1 Tax=Halogranum rubrum TaxID=553466 RepID=A0A1I4BA08_9EURY|nr:hypothetical protein [Halogranum rubrum]SFK64987.1 hypothetical protein SAMN04487950_0382 [Halogranum rubrum]